MDQSRTVDRRMILTRGRRVVIGGFESRRAVGQGRITMARNGGCVTQGYFSPRLRWR